MADRFDRFTEHALLTLMLAEEEARRLQHAYIGTEHLLLGLVREGNGVGARMLANLGVDLANVRAAVASIVGRGDLPSPAEMEMTPRAARVLVQAQEEAQRLSHDAIGTEHLLLGLAWDADGITAGVLESLGINPERVRAQMFRLLVERTPSSRSGMTPVDHAARLGELRRSLDAIRRAKESAITMQEYERIAQLSDQEAAVVAEIARIEASPGAAGRVGSELQPPAVTQDRLMQPERELGRTFRDAFDLGLALSPRARALLEGARTQAEMRGQSLIEPEHLLLAIAVPGTVLAREMEQRGIDIAVLTRAAERIVSDRLAQGASWPFGATGMDEVH